MVKKFTDVRVGDRQNMTVGGRSAVQYRIDCISKRIKVTFFHITVDGVNHFHQLLFSTGTNNVETNRADMNSILLSFRETL